MKHFQNPLSQQVLLFSSIHSAAKSWTLQSRCYLTEFYSELYHQCYATCSVDDKVRQVFLDFSDSVSPLLKRWHLQNGRRDHILISSYRLATEVLTCCWFLKSMLCIKYWFGNNDIISYTNLENFQIDLLVYVILIYPRFEVGSVIFLSNLMAILSRW